MCCLASKVLLHRFVSFVFDLSCTALGKTGISLQDEIIHISFVTESFCNSVQKRLRKTDEAFKWTDGQMFWARECRRIMGYDKLTAIPTNIKKKEKQHKQWRGSCDQLILYVFILCVNSEVTSHGSLVLNCFLLGVCH